jgi:hypothetical protein
MTRFRLKTCAVYIADLCEAVLARVGRERLTGRAVVGSSSRHRSTSRAGAATVAWTVLSLGTAVGVRGRYMTARPYLRWSSAGPEPPMTLTASDQSRQTGR